MKGFLVGKLRNRTNGQIMELWKNEVLFVWDIYKYKYKNDYCIVNVVS